MNTNLNVQGYNLDSDTSIAKDLIMHGIFQNDLDIITKKCLDYIMHLMELHKDKIIHFDTENAYWIDLNANTQQINSITSLLIFNDTLFFTINDEELSKLSLPISKLNSCPTNTFREVVESSFWGILYKAVDHTDAVEAVDMVNMIEQYYRDGK